MTIKTKAIHHDNPANNYSSHVVEVTDSHGTPHGFYVHRIWPKMPEADVRPVASLLGASSALLASLQWAVELAESSILMAEAVEFPAVRQIETDRRALDAARAIIATATGSK